MRAARAAARAAADAADAPTHVPRIALGHAHAAAWAEATALGAELRGAAEQQRANERSRLRAQQTVLAREWAAHAAAARRQSR